MSVDNLLTRRMLDEASELDSLLEGVVANLQPHPGGNVTASDLDRESAYANDMKKLQEMLQQPTLVGITALARELHEDHRIRRDITVSQAGHRALVASMLGTAYCRQQELLLRAGKGK